MSTSTPLKNTISSSIPVDEIAQVCILQAYNTNSTPLTPYSKIASAVRIPVEALAQAGILLVYSMNSMTTPLTSYSKIASAVRIPVEALAQAGILLVYSMNSTTTPLT